MYPLLFLVLFSSTGFAQEKDSTQLPKGTLFKFDVNAINKHCPDSDNLNRRKFYFVDSEIQCTKPGLEQYCLVEFHRDDLKTPGILNCRVDTNSGLVGDVAISFSSDPCPSLECVRGTLDFKDGFPVNNLKKNLGNFVAVYDAKSAARGHIHDGPRGSGKINDVVEKTSKKVNQIKTIHQ